MRSRYSAYAVGQVDHLFRTWHPRTRPDDLSPQHLEWTGLDVLDTVGGGDEDDNGVVEFEAHYLDAEGRGHTLHERSTFERRGGRWVYVAGQLG